MPALGIGAAFTMAPSPVLLADARPSARDSARSWLRTPTQRPLQIPSTTHGGGASCDQLAWEPRTGLRFALTTVRDGQLLIAVGQSLTPLEQRTARIGFLLVLSWLLTLALLAGGAILHLIVGRRLDYPRVSR